MEKWYGSTFSHSAPEREDPYIQLCFGEADPFDESFAQLAREIFNPILAHMESLA
jgi:hypothetical protein